MIDHLGASGMAGKVLLLKHLDKGFLLEDSIAFCIYLVFLHACVILQQKSLE